jgi:anaerobic ribonucleoside-triphosphate reductase activating protein
MLNIAHIERNNHVNGTGTRFVIWFQGCDFGCPHCWNKNTWNHSIANQLSVDALFEDIKQTSGITGVTFSGGEPLLQADELLELTLLLREKTELDIHIFTGFEPNEKRSNAQNGILSLANTIVFGRFDPTKENNNQKVESRNWDFNNSDVEIEIDNSGNLLLTGYPTDSLIETLQEI